jgi:hypothetical protein
MRKIISISEIVEAHEISTGTEEVCASAEADYDEEKSQLVVELASCFRVADRHGHQECVSRAWLPKAQTVKESVSLEEAVPAAKDIFQRWVNKVRDSIPSLAAC